MNKLYKIIKFGDPTLRMKATPISSFGASIHRLAEDMINTMKSQDGVGLAGNQICFPIQIVVVDASGPNNDPLSNTLNTFPCGLCTEPSLGCEHMPLVLINPEVKALGEDTEAGEEGCLSIEGVTGSVIRPAKVQVKALDVDGNPLEFEAQGFLSRVIQHEVDHLNGILFIDHLPNAPGID